MRKRNSTIIRLGPLSALPGVVVSWFMKVITPDSAVRLPRVALARETDDQAWQDSVPAQAVRL